MDRYGSLELWMGYYNPAADLVIAGPMPVSLACGGGRVEQPAEGVGDRCGRETRGGAEAQERGDGRRESS